MHFYKIALIKKKDLVFLGQLHDSKRPLHSGVQFGNVGREVSNHHLERLGIGIGNLGGAGKVGLRWPFMTLL